MKELRFRAWDTVTKSMCSKYHAIGFDGKVWFGNGDITGYPLVIMQYTGLKDANGTEIYEGDIIANTTAYYVYVVDSLNTVKPMLNYVKMANRCPDRMPKYPSQTFAEFGGIGDSDVIIGSDIIGGKPWQS